MNRYKTIRNRLKSKASATHKTVITVLAVGYTVVTITIDGRSRGRGQMA